MKDSESNYDSLAALGSGSSERKRKQRACISWCEALDCPLAVYSRINLFIRCVCLRANLFICIEIYYNILVHVVQGTSDQR